MDQCRSEDQDGLRNCRRGGEQLKYLRSMKTICFYFQVHQPWRLKRYRFFDMGRDHNYLDDLTNRSIMQKVARECYLPMNALLFNLIRQSEGRFRCTFSLTGLAARTLLYRALGHFVPR